MDRYSRQEIYLGKERQRILSKKAVTVVGIGALGTVTSELLARAGVGKLTLIDRDFVEESNLQRQTLFTEEDVGRLKAKAAYEHLKKINPDVDMEYFADDLSADNAEIMKADLVLDCVDNMETRFLIDDYCAKNKIPWVHASAIENRGFIFNVIPGKVSFSDVFNNLKGIGTCDTVGVMNTITSMIGSMQASEAIKILTGMKHEEEMIFVDLQQNIFRKLKAKKNPKFKRTFEHLKAKRNVIRLCGSGMYQILGDHDLDELKKRLKAKEEDGFIRLSNMTIFRNRALIKAKSEAEAKSIYSKLVGD